jgi:hypothetical protein
MDRARSPLDRHRHLQATTVDTPLVGPHAIRREPITTTPFLSFAG